MGATCDIYNQDCIVGMADKLADESIHLTVTSIPFEELFSYSQDIADLSNNGQTVDLRKGRFALNMRFVVEQLFRVTAPGCNVCIHIQQLLAFKNHHGFMGRRDFRGSMVDVFGVHGFNFIGEFAIPKNPQHMAQRLNLHSLQFKTGWGRNSCNLAPAPNDFVLIFQKPGECENKVKCLYDSKRNRKGWITTEEWIKWASGVWDDIAQMDVLDGYRSARETDEEKHVCPLQLEVIRRLVALYTNPIDMQATVKVLDPFMGIGSTAYICLCGETASRLSLPAERNVVGFELKGSYHDQATRNAAKAMSLAAERHTRQQPLFGESIPDQERAIAAASVEA